MAAAAAAATRLRDCRSARRCVENRPPADRPYVWSPRLARAPGQNVRTSTAYALRAPRGRHRLRAAAQRRNAAGTVSGSVWAFIIIIRRPLTGAGTQMDTGRPRTSGFVGCLNYFYYPPPIYGYNSNNNNRVIYYAVPGRSGLSPVCVQLSILRVRKKNFFFLQ